MKKYFIIFLMLNFSSLAEDKEFILSPEDKAQLEKTLNDISKTLPTKEKIENALKEFENLQKGKAGLEMQLLSFRMMGIAAFAADYCGKDQWKKEYENSLKTQAKSLHSKLKNAFDEGWAEAKKQSIEKLLPCEKAKK